MLKLARKWKPLSFLGMMAVALATGSMAHAQTFSTASGATESGGNPVNATATFHVTAGNVQIDVQNLIVNPTTVAQNISDLFFTITGPQTVGSFDPLLSSGAAITVAANGTFTSNGTIHPTHWFLDAYDGALGFHLNDIGGGQPDQTILGRPNGSGVYSAAGGSIAGNGPHNPFLVGDVTFNVAIAGLSATSTVNSATFSFGTAGGNNVTGGVPPQGGPLTPEGSSLFLMAPGLFPVFLYGIRRRFVKKA